MPYAINLADTTKQDRRQIIVKMVLAPLLINAKTVYVEHMHFDSVARVLPCDKDQASAIISIIRTQYKKYEWRCYYSKTGNGGWKSV